VASCCECGDEPSGSCATELVGRNYRNCVWNDMERNVCTCISVYFRTTLYTHYDIDEFRLMTCFLLCVILFKLYFQVQTTFVRRISYELILSQIIYFL
jgi:hypothetical protein